MPDEGLNFHEKLESIFKKHSLIKKEFVKNEISIPNLEIVKPNREGKIEYKSEAEKLLNELIAKKLKLANEKNMEIL
jgi:hypothetical protein